MNETKAKIKALAIIFFCCYALVSCFASQVKAENDTATTTNILPNAGTTSSSLDNHNLDGVNSGTGNLSNNSTHNGFTITCGTTVGGYCGKAFNGELESSYDMKVSASDTLIGIDGTESSTTYTSTQKKLDGGIQLNSYFSVQNCEDGSSSFSCGYSSGADDSYNLHIKIKDSNGNTLSEMTTTRTNDAGYNANSAKFHDNLVWNGTGAASYEWYWQGFDGSQSTSALRGPNLLGAELLLDFPTEDYEVFTTEEIEELNEALGTANLSENEIWDVISGMEAAMEEEFALTGNLEEGTRLEISFEEAGITLEIASQETGAIVMETAMVKETFSSVLEEKPIETLKEEIISMVQEEMPFMQIMEEVAPPAKMETMKEEVNAKTETPKETLPMVSKKETIATAKKEETQKITKAPPSMKTAKEEKPVEKKPTEMVKRETTNEEKKEEPKEEKPASETASKSTTETANRQEQEGVQSEKAQVTKLELVMKKVDAKIKNPIKNLEIKNLIKLDIMMGDKDALTLYQNAVFYEPKDIYLEQLQIFDERQIYANVSLATYVNNDKVAIKANTLHKLNLDKQRLLIELEQLKNGKI